MFYKNFSRQQRKFLKEADPSEEAKKRIEDRIEWREKFAKIACGGLRSTARKWLNQNQIDIDVKPGGYARSRIASTIQIQKSRKTA